MIDVDIHGPGNESGFGPDGQRQRSQRVINRAERAGFGPCPRAGRGGILPLGQPINLIVEQDNLHVHVAPNRVDQVVAAD